MSILPKLRLAANITRIARAQPGQLAYCMDRPSITACFYELLQTRGATLSLEESKYQHALRCTPLKLGRPCIILDRPKDGRYTIGFISQIRRGRPFSPLGRFFGVPLGTASSSEASSLSTDGKQLPHGPSTYFPPLHLTEGGTTRWRKHRFYFFAIPVVRQKIHIPPGEPRQLVPGDLDRALAFAHERVMTCTANHTVLRRDQLSWFEETPSWRFENPREGGVNLRTHIRL
ncbi:hypothetical protein B0H15DRAFT_253674 [Mycena belliarum]|uniref:Uncharacterized protein n=1 Tax=Mycena belliarum TaxID=1033014 RepID=A0AAD6XVA2_9AGAR|nr:hypothetical protein B0H15DRAFT_253674 [Mycena belliae]